jgi:hypothetical protein
VMGRQQDPVLGVRTPSPMDGRRASPGRRTLVPWTIVSLGLVRLLAAAALAGLASADQETILCAVGASEQLQSSGPA